MPPDSTKVKGSWENDVKGLTAGVWVCHGGFFKHMARPLRVEYTLKDGERYFEQLKSGPDGPVAGKRRESHSGGTRRGGGASPAGERVGRPEVGREGIEAIAQARPAWRLRERTTVSLLRASGELDRGHYTRVAQAVSRMKSRPGSNLE